MSGESRLIVNADDFGRSPGINAAIVTCHLKGLVSSTTLMVNLHWSEAAVRLLDEAPELGVGLHLNFCYGQPVARPDRVPSLVESDGTFITDTAWLAEHARERDVVVETRAQLRRFRELTGQPPTHADSHKYLHSTPAIRSAVIAVAREHRLPLRAVAGDDRAEMLAAGVKTTERFEGRFHGLDGIGVTGEVLAAALSDVGPGTTELMCHPGYVDEHIRDSSYAEDREGEVEALCDPAMLALVERMGNRRVTFADI